MSGSVDIFVCTRSADSPACKCNRLATHACSFPLRGPKAGQFCGKPLCERCGFGEKRAICEPHHGLMKREQEATKR